MYAVCGNGILVGKWPTLETVRQYAGPLKPAANNYRYVQWNRTGEHLLVLPAREDPEPEPLQDNVGPGAWVYDLNQEVGSEPQPVYLPMRSACYNRASRNILLAGTANGHVYSINYETDEFTDLYTDANAIDHLDGGVDGGFIVYATHGTTTLNVIKPRTCMPVTLSLTSSKYISALKADPVRPTMYAVGGSNGLVSICDLAVPTVVYNCLAHDTPVQHIAFNAVHNFIASLAEDRTMCVFDLRSPEKQVFSPDLNIGRGLPTCFAYAPNGADFVFGNSEGLILGIDLRQTKRLVAWKKLQEGPLRSIDFYHELPLLSEEIKERKMKLRYSHMAYVEEADYQDVWPLEHPELLPSMRTKKLLMAVDGMDGADSDDEKHEMLQPMQVTAQMPNSVLRRIVDDKAMDNLQSTVREGVTGGINVVIKRTHEKLQRHCFELSKAFATLEQQRLALPSVEDAIAERNAVAVQRLRHLNIGANDVERWLAKMNATRPNVLQSSLVRVGPLAIAPEEADNAATSAVSWCELLAQAQRTAEKSKETEPEFGLAGNPNFRVKVVDSRTSAVDTVSVCNMARTKSTWSKYDESDNASVASSQASSRGTDWSRSSITRRTDLPK